MQSYASYREQTPVVTNDGSHLQWAVPQRYISEVKSASTAQLWRRFFNSSQWFPATLRLDDCFCHSAGQYGFFQQLLPHVEDVHIFFNMSCRNLEHLPPAVLLSVLQAVVNAVKVNSLKSISLNTNFSYYLHWLIVQIITGL